MRRGVLVGGAVALALGGIGAALTERGAPGDAARARRPVDGQADFGARLRGADVAAGATLFAACAACHSVGRGGADLDGPNLYGVVGGPVADRRPRYGYSAALRQTGGTWTFARLDAWLTKPAAFAPGTTMTYAGLADAQDRADVIAFLNQQGSGVPVP